MSSVFVVSGCMSEGLCDCLSIGEHTRLLTESDPRLEVSVTCTDRKAYWTHVSSPLFGTCLFLVVATLLF